jgi:3-dehydroquinate dehydratase/shikimate dehydrogenase
MNNGKICVSVCARSVDELIARIKRAADSADVIEIRFDCLQENELVQALERLPQLSNLLITFRVKSEGGKRELTLADRIEFWKNFQHYNKNKDYFVDLEADTSYFENFVKGKKILSTHYFQKVPKDLASVFSGLSKSAKSSIIKIAVQTHDITDSIPVWQLLKRAKSEKKEIIPIAMGESGKWTRILGLAHGAFMTYASLDSDQETAPGQVTAGDLIEIYRAKELNEKTDVYGILGNNVGISLSPYIHNTAFKFHNLNAVFVPLQVHNLDDFIKRMVKPETREVELNFKGFSVTIPHKQNIIRHLDHLDETAAKIGAVNTVKIVDGKLHGYNTDAHGFIEPLKSAFGDLRGAKVAILGAGGAARACVYALKQNGAEVTVFARNAARAQTLADDFEVNLEEIPNPKSQILNQDIVVNTTPLGMKGKAEGETPVTAEQLKDVKLVYDLVYIPFQTQLMNEADKVDVPKIGGMAMLVAQAMEQQKIWTGLEAPLKDLSRVVLKRLQ